MWGQLDSSCFSKAISNKGGVQLGLRRQERMCQGLLWWRELRGVSSLDFGDGFMDGGSDVI